MQNTKPIEWRYIFVGILGVMLMLLITSTAHASSIVDSYSLSNQSVDQYPLDSGDITKWCQSFTATNAIALTNVDFYLKKVGVPTGNMTAVLRYHTGTYGSSSIGSDALTTSSIINASTLTTSYATTTFVFSTSPYYYLNTGAYYDICVEFVGGDTGNYVRVGGDNTSPTHSGNANYYLGSWFSVSSDNVFYVYGDTIGGGGGGGTNSTSTVYVNASPMQDMFYAIVLWGIVFGGILYLIKRMV